MPHSDAARGSAEPFDLRGGPDAVLLLHGLTGSPFEVRFLGERLAAAGMRCRAPILAGHPDPHALARTTWREWVAGARDELFRLAGARRTFAAGCSMGALVACALAHDHPDRVQGLVLLAPALRLRAAGVLGGLLGLAPGAFLLPAIPKRAGSDVRDPEMRRLNPCMEVVPLAAVGELLRLQAEVDRRLPAVRAPALVVFGARDHTVALAGAERLAARIGSGPARLVLLPESWHLVGIDVERERCAEEARRFLESIPA
ncbi:MAG TPA: alpha/beta fold hydrolase [Anaeromyxobacteraceae bacterium]|nr:alpha/beta fold hydrolase [Anaeromyxobacteraceae bacterium]